MQAIASLDFVAVTGGLAGIPRQHAAVILSLQMPGGASCMLPICWSAAVTLSFLTGSADAAPGAWPVGSGISPTVKFSCERLADSRFVAARVRLLSLMHNGSLIPESKDAYARGIGVLGRAPEAGPVPGGLAGVRMMDPEAWPGAVVLPLQWEAEDLTGTPQTVLDADLTVRPARGDRTALRLDGLFRLPFARTGPARDTGISVLRLAAGTTADSLLTAVAESLASPSQPLSWSANERGHS
jgi:hypothetical protein